MVEKLQPALQEREMAVRRQESNLVQEVGRVIGCGASRPVTRAAARAAPVQKLSQVHDRRSSSAPVLDLMGQHGLHQQALKQKRRAECLQPWESEEDAECRSVQRCQEQLVVNALSVIPVPV